MKKFLKYIGILILLILIYIVTLTLSSLIPSNAIKKNTEKSARQILDGYLNRQKHFYNYNREYFTDAVMIDIAYRIDNKKPLESAFKAEVKSIKEGIDSHDGYIPEIALADEMGVDRPPTQNQYNSTYDYGRFWHGYLIYLRPLLTFLNYNQISLINLLLLLGILIYFGILSYRNLGRNTTIILILGLFSINYFKLGLSISLVQTLIIIMIASIYILKRKEKIKDLNLLFLIIGSLTCFFSWMTFTPLTFGFPIMIYFLLNKDEDKKIKKLLFAGLFYFLGYGITWASKWILSDLIFHTNFIKNSLEQIAFRTSNDGMGEVKEANFITAFLHNFCFRIDVIMVELWATFLIIHNSLSIDKSLIKKTIKDDLVFVIIGLIPFLIYFVLPNHSVIHASLFSNKLLVLTELAFFIILEDLVKNSKNDKKLLKPLDKSTKS